MYRLPLAKGALFRRRRQRHPSAASLHTIEFSSVLNLQPQELTAPITTTSNSGSSSLKFTASSSRGTFPTYHDALTEADRDYLLNHSSTATPVPSFSFHLERSLAHLAHALQHAPVTDHSIDPENKVGWTGLLQILNVSSSIVDHLNLDKVEWASLNVAARKVQDALRRKAQAAYSRTFLFEPNKVNRTEDGLFDGLDDGKIHDFCEEPVPKSLAQAFEQVDLALETVATGKRFWICHLCQHCTSDEFNDHMATHHPLELKSGHPATQPPPPSMTLEYIIQEGSKSEKPALRVYSMETPIFSQSNKAARELLSNKSRFEMWRAFEVMLHHELMSLPAFRGPVYRAINFKPERSLYKPGNLITWNQPSSTSMSAHAIKPFLSEQVKPHGTIYTIHSLTGRLIREYSIYPEEEEVLLPCGSQFRVRGYASQGMKDLIAQAMDCNLSDVDIVELEEVVLNVYGDVIHALTADEIVRNSELIEFIKILPTAWRKVGPFGGYFSEYLNEVIEHDGRTALHIAAGVAQNEGVVQILASNLNAAQLDHRDKDNRTALEIALSSKGCGKAALYLAQRSASLDYLIPKCRMALLEHACIHGSRRVIQKLGKNLVLDDIGLKDHCSPVWIAAQHGHSEIVQLLFEMGANIHLANVRGESPLWVAAHNGHSKVVEMLASLGADPMKPEASGISPLWIAAMNGHGDTIRCLVVLGADVHQPDRTFGRAPIYIAARNGHVSVVRFLASLGADIEAVNYDGCSPLWISAQNGHKNVVLQLARLKADVNKADYSGITPLQIASRKGHKDVVSLLVELGAAPITLRSSVKAPTMA